MNFLRKAVLSLIFAAASFAWGAGDSTTARGSVEGREFIIESPLSYNAFIVADNIESTVKSNTIKPKVQFAWGADAGASIDLTANDMSSIDFNIAFGMKRGWINFLGIGAGADICVTNSTRAYPIFAEFRTGFSDKPTLLFWDIRGGMAYNYLEHNHEQLGVYANTGLGIHLARSAKFASYLSLSYTFRQRKKIVGTEMTHDFRNLHFVTARLGVTF